jgi:hypothetical protein
MDKQFISYSGTCGVGKTTSVFQSAVNSKMIYPNATVTVLHENAKHSPYKINKETCSKSQMWIFCNQIQQELFLYSSYDIVIADRTCIDAVAYTKRAGFNTLAESMFNLALEHVNVYTSIVVKTIEKNDFCYEDKVRDTDPSYRKDIDNIIKEYYYRLINIKPEMEKIIRFE